MKKIGSIVKELRLSAEMSADSLAEKLGRTGISKKQYVYDIEKGRLKRIDIETLKKISNIFNVPLESFINIDPENQTHNSVKVHFRNDVPNTINWQQKYVLLLEEHSELKSKYIELMKQLSP